MESSSKAGNTLVSFMQQMLHNKFLLLIVVLGVGVAVFISVGVFRLIGH
jgi:hypothetical protein